MVVDWCDFHVDDEGNLILDENDKPIPKNICLCFAHGPTECCCGAWDDVEDWDYG